MTWKRRVVAITTTLALLGAIGWQYQSRLVGWGARIYLQRVAAAEERNGDLTERTKVVLNVHRMLLLQPPPTALVAELYDVTTTLAERAASGALSWNWSTYLYTAYMRDAVRERPNGQPRRSGDEVRAAMDQAVAFFSIRQRPDAPGMGVADLLGESGESFTLEEIEAAHRQGHDLGWAGSKPQ